MTFASADTTIPLSHTWLAFANFGFSGWCHVVYMEPRRWMVDTVLRCDSRIDSIEGEAMAVLRFDCHSMLFLDLKHLRVSDTSTVYGQSRSETVAVAFWVVELWLCEASTCMSRG